MFKMTSRRNALMVMGLMAAGACFAQDRRGGREFLGESHVDGGADHDNIRVTGARGEFRAIQIRVEGGAVEFDRILVHFGDGQTTPIRLRSRIASNGESRVLDLPGRRRVIESVEFWYRKGRWASRPRVALFGIH
jgi:hypothetical protein